MPEPAILWPERFKPENCAVHAVNSIEVPAKPEAVWQWLIAPLTWPEWYSNASNVTLDGSRLEPGKRFVWKTFGVTIDTVVEEFVPCERLAWRAKAFALDVYHAWLITPTQNGCRVLTEETQHGLLPRLSAMVFPGRMERLHQVWLEGLCERATSGKSPD